MILVRFFHRDGEIFSIVYYNSSMMSLNVTCLVQPCRADKSVMASSGFQADVKALQKLLAARHSVRVEKLN